jgi:flagellar protein FlaG
MEIKGGMCKMIDLLNSLQPVSSKDARTPILSLSHPGSSKVESKNQRVEAIPVKKENAPFEEIEKKSRESMERTIETLKNFVESHNNSLKFQVHQGTGDIVIKVISEKDGRVIREIPPEKLHDLIANLEDFSGALFNKKA